MFTKCSGCDEIGLTGNVHSDCKSILLLPTFGTVIKAGPRETCINCGGKMGPANDGRRYCSNIRCTIPIFGEHGQ